MSRVRVYIKPFDDDGNYQADYIEVTKDVVDDSISAISVNSDLSDFNVGVIRNNQLKLSILNTSGKYSEVGTVSTIFKTKRAGSLVKITFDFADADYQTDTGAYITDQVFLTDERDVFIGLLTEDDFIFDVNEQVLSFSALGRESIFNQIEVPIASLSNGDTVSAAIYDILNQSLVTDIMTLNLANINPDNDLVLDTVADLEGLTGREALNKLLLHSNSVLYIENNSIIVSGRTASTDVEYNFYNDTSPNGIENIERIGQISTGVRRIINYAKWSGTTVIRRATTSISLYGVRKREIGFSAITTEATRESSLDAIINEFADPKQEFDLTTKMNFDTIALKLFDRVSIDYPNQIISTENLPYYGVAEYGTAQYPTELTSFTILPEDHYKIISKSLNLKNETVKLKLRAI